MDPHNMYMSHIFQMLQKISKFFMSYSLQFEPVHHIHNDNEADQKCKETYRKFAEKKRRTNEHFEPNQSVIERQLNWW